MYIALPKILFLKQWKNNAKIKEKEEKEKRKQEKNKKKNDKNIKTK